MPYTPPTIFPTRDRTETQHTLFWRKRRGNQTWRAVRNGNMKYISDQQGEEKTKCLLDLVSDPEEKNNLIAIQDGTASNLHSLLQAWERDVKAKR